MTAPTQGRDRRNIEAIHPLSPMQTSLLFASVRAGRSADPGFLQLRCTLVGDLDEAAFETAWRRVMARHAALRSAVRWQDLDRPLQVTFREVEPEWIVEDWRADTPAAVQRRWESFLDGDRSRGLDVTRAPVMRVSRIRVGDRTWRVVWSCHHVLLDGWSGSIVLSEVLKLCNATMRGVPAAPERAGPAYREYVAWLQRRDASGSEAFWRESLAGLDRPTPLPFGGPAAPAAGLGQVSLMLDETATRAIERAARRDRITVGTLTHGAWALVLAATADRLDVCFGTTTSGRSAPLQSIESMVGVFIGALPVRVTLDPDSSISGFLQRLQSGLTALRVHEHDSPSQIQAWSVVPGHLRLFDSLVVFENFPPIAEADPGAPVRLASLDGGVTSTYPVTIIAAPGPRLGLGVMYDGTTVEAAAARRMLDTLAAMLTALADAPDRRVSDLIAAPAATPRPDSPTDAGHSRPDAAAGHNWTAAAPTQPDPARAAQPVTRSGHPPRDDLELRLVQIWERVLGLQPIGIRDDFFEIGGNSLNAVELFDRIDHVLGKRLPLATLFEVPTVEQLADRFRDRGWVPPWSALVAMQHEGDRTPVFAVHSYEGHLLFYRDLARRLAPDQPVWGLQSVGLDGSRPPLATVEEMAAHYIEQIRTVQPTGSYRLIGMCFGIAVVFEMAQRLLSVGEPPAELIILDSGFLTRLPSPATTQPAGPLASRVVRRARAHARGLRTRSGRLLTRLAENDRERAARRVREANERAFFRYEAERFPGRVTLIRSEEYGTRQDWHLRTWSELVGTLETQVVPGDHFRMLEEPYVGHLAAVLRTRLAGFDDPANPAPAASPVAPPWRRDARPAAHHEDDGPARP